MESDNTPKPHVRDKKGQAPQQSQNSGNQRPRDNKLNNAVKSNEKSNDNGREGKKEGNRPPSGNKDAGSGNKGKGKGDQNRNKGGNKNTGDHSNNKKVISMIV